MIIKEHSKIQPLIYRHPNLARNMFNLDGPDYFNSIRTLIARESRLLESDRLNSCYKPEDSDKLKGDIFEFFIEVFCKCYTNDPCFGISEYTRIPESDDYGVDAIGKLVDGTECAIQIKYRSNINQLIEYEMLAKTDTSARRHFNIDTLKKNSIILFTSTKGVTAPCETVFKDSLKIINNKFIRDYIYNNLNFISSANILVEEMFDKFSKLSIA